MITKTHKRNILVNAISAKEAEIIACNSYKSCDVSLGWDGNIEVDFLISGDDRSHYHNNIITPYFRSSNRDFTLLHGDCFQLLCEFDFKFSCIFADPPYFLSNGGISVQSGKIVSVNKGDWDKGKSHQEIMEFNMKWLGLCREKLKDNGTIWISGTYHNIFSVANCLTELGYKILNVVTWAKTNPPPNISCRYFTYSTEFIIWARKSEKRPHYFNYNLMKQINNNKQMTDVWHLPAIARWEKSCGKHPTQKPLALLARIIMASTQKGEWVFDPFCGSSTTGIAANLLGRRYLGIDKEEKFIEISKNRREELENIQTFHKYRSKIKDIQFMDSLYPSIVKDDSNIIYGDLPL